MPLDIEIFLHTPPNATNEASTSRSRHSALLHGAAAWAPAGLPPPAWMDIDTPPNAPEPGSPGPIHAHLHGYPPILAHNAVLAVPNITGVGVAALHNASSSGQDTARQQSQNGKSRSSMHWGHIAFYYLTEQMHRWERFVFRFDKRFVSVDALKSVIGE